jgi:hypothetical protein
VFSELPEHIFQSGNDFGVLCTVQVDGHCIEICSGRPSACIVSNSFVKWFERRRQKPRIRRFLKGVAGFVCQCYKPGVHSGAEIGKSKACILEALLSS